MRPVERTGVSSDPSKTSRWPRTDRRGERIDQVLAHRQPTLAVVLENVHDPHNVAAVLRSCDAVGVLVLHLVYTVEAPPATLASTTSGSASKWIEVIRHDAIEACYGELRAEGKRILVTALRDESVDLHHQDLVEPVAIVFGNEKRGASDDAIAQADGTMFIPMMGMVESLNISVACAVTLYEAMRQRKAVGMYDVPQMSEGERQAWTAAWLER
jgi:tRNA (guanosine-2'-O-)-methyltransferase